MDIQETIQQKKDDITSEGNLLSKEIVVTLERETMIEKLQELEARIAALEKSK